MQCDYCVLCNLLYTLDYNLLALSFNQTKNIIIGYCAFRRVYNCVLLLITILLYYAFAKCFNNLYITVGFDFILEEQKECCNQLRSSLTKKNNDALWNTNSESFFMPCKRVIKKATSCSKVQLQ